LVAGVAQLVEQRIRNAKVGSSTLFTGTIQLTRTDESSAGFLLSEQKTVEQTSQFSSLHFFISDSFSGNSQEVPGKNSLAG
jgi:hypothetical protein